MFHAFDIECTTRCPKELGFPGSPFFPGNKVLAYGVTSADGWTHVDYGLSLDSFLISGGVWFYGDVPVAGHNSAFDLHWLRRKTADEEWVELQRGMVLWDTQIAEHVLTSGRAKFSKLDDLAVKYKAPGGGKHADVSEYIQDGRIEDVPREKLADYLKQDLAITHHVAYQQYTLASAAEVRLIGVLSEALKAIEEMEWNGLHVDRDKLTHRMVANNESIKQVGLDMELFFGLLTGLGFDVRMTPSTLSAVLFGGTVKWETKVPNGVYKTGKRKGEIKFKREKHERLLPRALDPEYFNAAMLKTGWFQVDERVLAAIGNATPPPDSGTDRITIKGLVDCILTLRALDKVQSTYLEALLRCMELSESDIVHHSINPAATATGRYSSSSPNLQNTPMQREFENLNVKDLFTSRWGDSGVMVEADFKQLEVVALAAITGDPQLVSDLKNGIDIHSETGKPVFGAVMTEQQRRTVKTINFGLIYGGGAPTLAEQAGVPVGLTRNLINAFYHRYPQTRKHFDNKSLVEWNAGCDSYILSSRTGRSWAIPMSDRGKIEPNYTKLRNYPVQGTATGDLVPLVIATLFHKLLENNFFDRKCLMVNTVHDSIIFDIHKDVLEDALPAIKSVMESAPELMRDTLDCDWFMGLPVKAEIKYGRSWGECDTKYT